MKKIAAIILSVLLFPAVSFAAVHHRHHYSQGASATYTLVEGVMKISCPVGYTLSFTNSVSACL